MTAGRRPNWCDDPLSFSATSTLAPASAHKPFLASCASLSLSYCLGTRLCIERVRHGKWVGLPCRHMDHSYTTSVLLIDESKNQRTYWAEQLKRSSPDYVIVEASDGQSGLDLFQSRQIDCVVLELGLPDESGFQTLVKLVPIATRPQVAVIVLTQMSHRGISKLAKEYGAYACFVKRHITGEDLDKAIQHAVTFVAQVKSFPSEYYYLDHFVRA